jgi:hypothetical protein
MFADAATATQALDEYFNEPGVDLLRRLMQPVVLFEPVEGGACFDQENWERNTALISANLASSRRAVSCCFSFFASPIAS